MKKFTSVFLLFIIVVLIAAGCSSKKVNVTFNKKNNPLPDYVLNSSQKVKETYIMASNYPEVLSQVPCFCGCGKDAGHVSNLQCYIDKMGPNHAVEQWDNMSIS